MNQRIKIILALVLAAGVGVGGYCAYNQYQHHLALQQQKQEEQARLQQEQENQQLSEVQSHYAEHVVTTGNTDIYGLTDEQTYEVIGQVSEGIVLEPQNESLSFETEYFYIPEVDGYVKYQDVTPQEEAIVYDTRHLNYIPFNKTIHMDRTTLYDVDGNLLYDYPTAASFPILIKEDTMYGVNYNDRLVWVKKDDVKEIVKETNSTAKKATKIRVLAYHKVYDPKEETCTTIICHTLSQMSKHFKYLNSKGYFTMSCQEMYWYITKKANMPYQSVMVTFDDGGPNTKNTVKLVEKYNIHATLFLIGKKYKSYMDSPNLELQSHTYALHEYGKCKISPRGSALLCSDNATVMADLKKSKELTNAIAIAYPYYEYNNTVLKQVKKAGFLLGFEDEKGLVSPGDDPYTISRYTLTSYASVNELASILH